MGLSVLITAGVLAAPLPVPTRQAGPADYPTRYLQAERSAAAIIEIIIDPDGRIAQCREIEAFGDVKFAHEFCTLQKSSRWRAAVDESGKPTYGLVRTLFRMFIPNSPQGDEIARLAQLPELELTVNRLPAAADDHLDIKISLQVDASGTVTNCEPRPDQAVPRNFAAEACAQANQLKFGIVRLGNTPLPGFVIEQKVRFVKQSTTDKTPS